MCLKKVAGYSEVTKVMVKDKLQGQSQKFSSHTAGRFRMAGANFSGTSHVLKTNTGNINKSCVDFIGKKDIDLIKMHKQIKMINKHTHKKQNWTRTYSVTLKVL